MKLVFAFLAILATIGVSAQQNKNVKLYAYSQKVTPGTQKAPERDENGNRVPAAETSGMYNYMLYAVSSSPARVYPVELWLKGKKYGVSFKTITQTPVTHSAYGNAEKKVLVPKTSGKVLQLIPTDVYADKEYPKAEKLAGENELVFVYKQNGKFYYQTLPQLTSLAAANLQ